jgi:molybdopterin-guanine dinucleotide biosynthesis protein A
MTAMLSVVIQAGGRSSRMGSDKALVLLGGKTMIEHVLARVAGLGDEIIITTNNPGELGRFGLPLVADPIPGAGALFGLQTALAAAHESHVLLAACDMPFLQRPLLERLIALAPRADVVVPRIEGRFEPLLAVYARTPCLEAVQRAIDAGERRMISFFPQVEVLALDEEQLRPFDPHQTSFFNVNTPEDLRRAEEMLAAPGQSYSDDGGMSA